MRATPRANPERNSIKRGHHERKILSGPEHSNSYPKTGNCWRCTRHCASSAISNVAAARSGEDIFRNAESLHQELVFKANRKRIYEIFTSTALFDNMTRDIQAQEGGNASPAHPTEISHDPGGAFSLFGGRIVGRHLELVPNERIVQAWRVAYWDPGVFSIVRFDFTEQGARTKLVFAHTGFPQ